LATQERLFGAIYSNLENASRTKASTDQATNAQSWLQEVVYGGVDGLAYMRSVAEFVAQNPDDPEQGLNPALAEYVDDVVIDELTEHRHRAIESALADFRDPDKNASSAELPDVPSTQLDLGSLISEPNELFDAENAWAGAGAIEDAAVLSRALKHASHLLEQLQTRQAGSSGVGAGAAGIKMEEATEESLDKEERRDMDLETELRMNLIALAKRAPLDQIAKMPPELVPPHLRSIVPTIGS